MGLTLTLPRVYSKVTSLLDRPAPLTSATTAKVPVIWLPRVTVREVVLAAVTVPATPPTCTSLSLVVAEKPVPVTVIVSPA